MPQGKEQIKHVTMKSFSKAWVLIEPLTMEQSVSKNFKVSSSKVNGLHKTEISPSSGKESVSFKSQRDFQ